LSVGLDMLKVRLPSSGNRSMYSRKQFAALELMCRERAALAKKMKWNTDWRSIGWRKQRNGKT
jgi:hypothetical protein